MAATACPVCGSPEAPGAQFCRGCGMRLDADIPVIELARDEPPPIEESGIVEHEPTRGGRWLAGAAVALVAMALFGWAVSDDDGEAEPAATPTTAAEPEPTTERDTATTAPRRATTTTSSTTTLPPGPVLGEPVGAVLYGIDTGGRLYALDLDTGGHRRSEIRTDVLGSFDGDLVVRVGCLWSRVDLETLEAGGVVAECGFDPYFSFAPTFSAFARHGPRGVERLIIPDGDGGVTRVRFEDLPLAELAHAIVEQRLLVQVPGAGMLWYEPETATTAPFADGQIIAAGTFGLLWSTCDASLACTTWYGTPDEPQRTRVALGTDEAPGALTLSPGDRWAVVTDPDDGGARLIDLQSGTAAPLDLDIEPWNLGWTPDGGWLLGFEQRDQRLTAVSIEDGRTVDLRGTTGQRGTPFTIVPKSGAVAPPPGGG